MVNNMVVNLYNRRIYQWVRHTKIYDLLRTFISARVVGHWIAAFDDSETLFCHVEIETINRCNGTCSFCPVNRNDAPRKLTKMSREPFDKIIDELSDMNYSGNLCLFSNNEPFNDDRMTDLLKYAKIKVPNAYHMLFSNGSLLTKERFEASIPYLDKLVIDNYNDDLGLNESSRHIDEWCRKNPE